VILKTVLVLLLSLSASAQSLSELLEKTAAAYKTDTYDIQVEFASFTRYAGGTQLNGPEASFAPASSPNHMRLIRSGKKMRLEAKNGLSGAEYITISDGRKDWRFERDGHEYTETDADAWPDPPAPFNQKAGPPHFDWRFFSRFRPIASALPQAKLIGMDQTCGGSPSAHVQIQIGKTGAVDSVFEDLWLDTATGLVCKLNSKSTYVLRGTLNISETTTTWRYANVGGPVDSALLVFAPPSPDARKVRSLRRNVPIDFNSRY
jgi:hypothetical protein